MKILKIKFVEENFVYLRRQKKLFWSSGAIWGAKIDDMQSEILTKQ